MEVLRFTHTLPYNDPCPNGRDIKPIIPVVFIIRGKELTFPMLIDSGSYWTGLPIDIADGFDINLMDLQEEIGTGAGGDFSFKIMPDAELIFYGEGTTKVSINCPIIFNQGIEGWPYGILGREGFFENFVVGFKHKDMDRIYLEHDI